MHIVKERERDHPHDLNIWETEEILLRAKIIWDLKIEMQLGTYFVADIIQCSLLVSAQVFSALQRNVKFAALKG